MLPRGAKHPGGIAVPPIRVGAGGHRPRRTSQLVLIRSAEHARGTIRSMVEGACSEQANPHRPRPSHHPSLLRKCGRSPLPAFAGRDESRVARRNRTRRNGEKENRADGIVLQAVDAGRSGGAAGGRVAAIKRLYAKWLPLWRVCAAGLAGGTKSVRVTLFLASNAVAADASGPATARSRRRHAWRAGPCRRRRPGKGASPVSADELCSLRSNGP